MNNLWHPGHAYEQFDIQTSHEARAFCLGMLLAGSSRAQIADATGECLSRVDQYVKNPRPTKTTTRSKVLDAEAPNRRNCKDCGTTLMRLGTVRGVETAMTPIRGQLRCAACELRRRQKAAKRNRGRLLEWANREGIVPNRIEAPTITGLSRSQSMKLVQEVFGRDERIGAQRRQGRRPWPPVST